MQILCYRKALSLTTDFQKHSREGCDFGPAFFFSPSPKQLKTDRESYIIFLPTVHRIQADRNWNRRQIYE